MGNPEIDVKNYETLWNLAMDDVDFNRSNTSPNALVFTDRDGVLCKNRREGVLSVDMLELVPGFHDAMSILGDAKLSVAVVSNQPYISQGTLMKQTAKEINDALKVAAKSAGIGQFEIFICPHSENDDCACRKPNIGLLDAAIAHFEDSTRTRYYMIGDQLSDMEAGRNLARKYNRAKVRTILIDWKYGLANHMEIPEEMVDYRCSSLLSAALWIRMQESMASRISYGQH